MYNRGEDNLNSNFNCRKGEMLVSKIYILGYLTFWKKKQLFTIFTKCGDGGGS